MITAKESKEIADRFNTNKTKTQKEDVYKLIRSTRIVGGYCCSWYTPLLDAVIADLKENGFFVETAVHNNETTVTIKW